MTAKQKQAAEDAKFDRISQEIRQTSREEWLALIEMYETEDPDATLTEPVNERLRRVLSAARQRSENRKAA